MPKKAVIERAFLCKIKHEEERYLDFVTVKVIQTKQRASRKTRISYSVLYDMGKSFRLPARINRDHGPYTSVEQAMRVGMEKLSSYMESIAYLEYSFEDGIIEVGIIKTGEGFIATASISGRSVFWTEERALSAETIFDMEEYLHDNFKKVKRISNG